MDQYPIIKVPDFLSGINFFEEPIEDIPEPKEPTVPKIKNNSIWLILAYIFLGMPIISVTLQIPGFILSFLGLFLLLYKLESKAEEDRQIILNKYENDLKKYQDNYELFMEKLNLRLKRYSEVEVFNQNPFLKILALHNARVAFTDKAKIPADLNSSFKKGVSEQTFYIHLKTHFNEKIKTDLSLGPYIPDFVYFDPFYNFYIDIEIDEPYEGITKMPIHCIGTDNSRDSFFLKNRWSVIRFTEKQIVCQPNACCDEIRRLVNSIFFKAYDTSVIKESVIKENAWEYHHASRMAANNFRDSYLLPKI